MINLSKIYMCYLAKAKCEYQGTRTIDNDAIAAIHSNNIQVINNWLQNYGVFRGYSPNQKNCVAGAVASFKRSHTTNPSRSLTKSQIFGEFQRLETAIRPCAPITNRGNPWDVTSLTSKALWLHYPYDIPIYDRMVRQALQVMTKLMGIGLANTCTNCKLPATCPISVLPTTGANYETLMLGSQSAALMDLAPDPAMSIAAGIAGPGPMKLKKARYPQISLMKCEFLIKSFG